MVVVRDRIKIIMIPKNSFAGLIKVVVINNQEFACKTPRTYSGIKDCYNVHQTIKFLFIKSRHTITNVHLML